MEQFGFIRVAATAPTLQAANPIYNRKQMETLIHRAAKNETALILFPELSLSAYSCQDLFLQQTLLQAVEQEAIHLAKATKDQHLTAIVGAPVPVADKLYNCALVLSDGQIKGIVPKSNIPGYTEFYEPRWFSPASALNQTSVHYGTGEVPIGVDLIFSLGEAKIAVEICEDFWINSPPSSTHAAAGANLICNLSASNAVIGKKHYRKLLVKSVSFSSHCCYLYASAGVCESTTDTLYSGHLMIAENGTIRKEAEQTDFSSVCISEDLDLERIMTDRRIMNTFLPSDQSYRLISLKQPQRLSSLQRSFRKTPFIPASNRNERMKEIIQIQSLSLARRLKHAGNSRPVIGISGGLDSTLALLIAVRSVRLIGLTEQDVLAVTMPGFGTTTRTKSNAQKLMDALGVTSQTIDITDACRQHFKDIHQDERKKDITYENTQARERTQILMDLANQKGGLVVGTGDLSELALGFATYGGDQISMYGVNAGIPKTLMRYLVEWIAHQYPDPVKSILLDILNTPVSPELLPPNPDGTMLQQTEQVLGDYQLHDFFLYYFIRFRFSFEKIKYLAEIAFADEYSKEEISRTLTVFVRRFFAQQFKRSCLPDGPKVGSVSLSPRSDWKMPSDLSAAIWLEEIETTSSPFDPLES